MSQISTPEIQTPIVYPESDGQPMADNTQQFHWITLIKQGLDALFRDDPLVFIAGDLLWYPVEGNNKLRSAPDVMVVFGRPKGDRGSYLQWLEDGIAPQVVFEILSPGNRPGEMIRRLSFYEEHGVEECYVYDPDDGELTGKVFQNGHWCLVPSMQGWVSPRLHVRFELQNGQLQLIRPDGQRILSYDEIDQRLVSEIERANAAEARAAQLSAMLKTLGVDPNTQK